MSSILPNRRTLRCAIYTRKSTEEGLEQEFNSLDAQREACAAYILSQRHEGWTLVPGDYDDGGFSGGNMERPGLRRLLEEVRQGRVDVIVVYKVDRLTRSLADFAKIVEVLDARGACFVSITQAFNTTTSMGRLTLNVLLSFAQFEREVTGERIRDKIAASKKKGLWMGGPVPLGYDVLERRLVVNEAEAGTVRSIYTSYIELGTVPALIAHLNAAGIRTKVQQRVSGPHRGGIPFARGSLYHLLRNRIYLGEIVHKGAAYPGAHDPIIDADLWQAVQDQLAANGAERRSRRNVQYPSLLAGLLYDGHGRRLSPSHAARGPVTDAPKRGRFRKGVSGNPRGRPRKQADPVAELHPAAEPTRALIREEGMRRVTLRDGEGMQSLTTTQAVLRALAVAAIKSGPMAQRTYLYLQLEEDRRYRAEQTEWLNMLLALQRRRHEEIRDCLARGIAPPDYDLHPDDIAFDWRALEVRFLGAYDPASKARVDRLVLLRDHVLELSFYHQEDYRVPDHPDGSGEVGVFFWLYVHANLLLPPRLQLSGDQMEQHVARCQAKTRKEWEARLADQAARLGAPLSAQGLCKSPSISLDGVGRLLG